MPTPMEISLGTNAANTLIVGSGAALPVTNYVGGAVVSGSNPLPVTTSGAAAGGTYTATDKTVTSATGASQTIAAAAATRKAILIKNGNSTTGLNLLGGTAIIGGAGTATLAPLEGVFLEGAACPVGAITVISTVAAYITAIEYT